MLAAYANRGGYLMATGRPAAQVASTTCQQHVDGDEDADPARPNSAGSCTNTRWSGTTSMSSR